LRRVVFARTAEAITTRDPSWVGRLDVAAISRGSTFYPRGFMAPSPYWTLSSHAGLDYTMLICEVDRGTDAGRGGVAQADILVDVTALGRLLAR